MTATVLPQTKRRTLEDFNALPEGPPYYEFDEGELIEVHSPTVTHQDITALLFVVLRARAHHAKIGRAFMNVDVYLPDGRVYIPDFGVASEGDFGSVDGKVHGAPLLVAEVTSSDEARDRAHKFRVYFDNGVAWYWLISQSLIIEEYRHTSDGYLRVSTTAPGEVFRPQLFPGLEIDLAALLGVEEGEAVEAEPADLHTESGTSQ